MSGDRMRRTYGFVCLAVVHLTMSSVQAGGPPKFEMTDAEVLKVVTQGPRVPAGFYSEDLPASAKGTKTSVNISWVRQLKKESRRYVYAWANSLAEAKALTQQALDNSNVPAAGKRIVGEEATKAYYQFQTEHPVGDKTVTTLHRVWRGDFFQPGDDFASRYFDERGTFKIGKLTGKRDEDTIRWLAQFLWWTENHNVLGTNVLAGPLGPADRSSVSETLFTTATLFGDSGRSEVVRVLRWELSVDRATGVVSQTVEQIRRIKAKR
jgi:hypothetical protein